MNKPISKLRWKSPVLAALVVATVFVSGRAGAQKDLCQSTLASSIFTLGVSQTLFLYVNNVQEAACLRAVEIPIVMELLNIDGLKVAEQSATILPGKGVSMALSYDQIVPGAGGRRQELYFRLRLQDALISSIAVGGSISDSEFPRESISITFEKVEVKYHPSK